MVDLKVVVCNITCGVGITVTTVCLKVLAVLTSLRKLFGAEK